MARPRIRALSAGVVPVREGADGPELLLLRAYRHWDFPKGRVEAGELPLEAAIREVEEETGLTDLDFVWGEASLDTGPYGHGKVSRYFVARTGGVGVTLPVNPELGRPEHHEFRWLSPEAAAARVTPRVYDVLEWALAIIRRDSPARRTRRSAPP